MQRMESDDIPAYLRLRAYIAAMILEGNYQDGDMLPSLRVFAAEHGANPLTVARAYQSFQEDGLVIVKRGIGFNQIAFLDSNLRDDTWLG